MASVGGITVCSGIGTPQQFCVPCRGSYTFDLIIYNDLLEGDETISLTANEIPSTYSVLLGRKTIKNHNISLKCFRFFSNLETEGFRRLQSVCDGSKTPTL